MGKKKKKQPKKPLWNNLTERGSLFIVSAWQKNRIETVSTTNDGELNANFETVEEGLKCCLIGYMGSLFPIPKGEPNVRQRVSPKKRPPNAEVQISHRDICPPCPPKGKPSARRVL